MRHVVVNMNGQLYKVITEIDVVRSMASGVFANVTSYIRTSKNVMYQNLMRTFPGDRQMWIVTAECSLSTSTISWNSIVNNQSTNQVYLVNQAFVWYVVDDFVVGQKLIGSTAFASEYLTVIQFMNVYGEFCFGYLKKNFNMEFEIEGELIGPSYSELVKKLKSVPAIMTGETIVRNIQSGRQILQLRIEKEKVEIRLIHGVIIVDLTPHFTENELDMIYKELSNEKVSS
jgi:hypothetical protein